MSLNGSMCLTNAAGQLLTSPIDTSLPDGFNGGTPILNDRRITMTAGSGSLYRVAGLAYDIDGRLAVAGAGPIINWVAGVPVDSVGRMVIEAAPVFVWAQNAIPITASGAVAVSSVTLAHDLFDDGEQGVWFDPSDLGTMSQDMAGEVPVTAPGQPVGMILDKSGNENHARLTNVTLQVDEDGLYYLDFIEGSSLETLPINFTGTDKLTMWVGLQKTLARFVNH